MSTFEGRRYHQLDQDEVLKTRALALANKKRLEFRENENEVFKIVKCTIGQEQYGIELAFIQEIFFFKFFTEIPGLPPFVLGLINVRGQIVSVVDLRKFFDIPAPQNTLIHQAIILNNDEMAFGLLVDDIEGVCDILQQDLQSSLLTLTGVRKRFLKGVSKDHTILLDGAKLLSDPTMKVEQS